MQLRNKRHGVFQKHNGPLAIHAMRFLICCTKRSASLKAALGVRPLYTNEPFTTSEAVDIALYKALALSTSAEPLK